MNWLTDPWGWWVEPFVDNPFMRDALWAALLTVVCTSVIGTWVVLRGLSFLGDALAHGVLPGIAIAFVLGGSTTLGALVPMAHIEKVPQRPGFSWRYRRIDEPEKERSEEHTSELQSR